MWGESTRVQLSTFPRSTLPSCSQRSCNCSACFHFMPSWSTKTKLNKNFTCKLLKLTYHYGFELKTCRSTLHNCCWPVTTHLILKLISSWSNTEYGDHCVVHPELVPSADRCVASVGGWYTGTPGSTRGRRPLMMSAAFSAIMMVGAFRLPLTMLGMMEESTTRSRSSPRTRTLESTTAVGSDGEPILQVQEGW